MSTDTPGDVALIGTGVMGEAILSSLVAAAGADRVRVTDGRLDHGRAVASGPGVRWCESNAAAADGAAVVVVAVKPKDVGQVADDIGSHLTSDTLVVSIAAGITTAFLEGRLPPGTAVVRVMPNTPATIGQGVSVLSGGAHAGAHHLDLVSSLLAGTGTVERVDERYQDVVTAISGSGPAYVFYVIDALAEAGVVGGLGRDFALELARRTVLGSAAMAVSSGEHPAVLRERVSSPGGTTVAAVRELDARGVRAAFVAAAEKAWLRSAELGEQLGH